MGLKNRATTETFTHMGITIKRIRETLSDQSLVYDIEVTSTDSGDLSVIFPCHSEVAAQHLFEVLKENVKRDVG